RQRPGRDGSTQGAPSERLDHLHGHSRPALRRACRSLRPPVRWQGSREQHGGGVTLWQDVLYGFWLLLQKPGFTVVAALSLALGIGANTLIFSLINSTLLRPLAFRDPGRLVVLWSVPLQHKDQRNNVTVLTYFHFRDKSRSYEAVGASNGAAK